jgi:hypothetical protein
VTIEDRNDFEIQLAEDYETALNRMATILSASDGNILADLDSERALAVALADQIESDHLSVDAIFRALEVSLQPYITPTLSDSDGSFQLTSSSGSDPLVVFARAQRAVIEGGPEKYFWMLEHPVSQNRLLLTNANLTRDVIVFDASQLLDKLSAISEVHFENVTAYNAKAEIELILNGFRDSANALVDQAEEAKRARDIAEVAAKRRQAQAKRQQAEEEARRQAEAAKNERERLARIQRQNAVVQNRKTDTGKSFPSVVRQDKQVLKSVTIQGFSDTGVSVFHEKGAILNDHRSEGDAPRERRCPHTGLR